MKIKNLFIVFLLLSAIQAHAQKNEEEIRSAIEAQVNQRHPSLPPGFWEGLGAESIPVIKKMYVENNGANERSFLIDGLGHFADADVGKFLEAQVGSTENEVLKKKLLTAVIQSEGEAAFDFVEPFLKSEDGHIRSSVARGLLAYQSNDKIHKRLEEFRNGEKTPWVLDELKKGPTEGIQKTRNQLNANPNQSVAVVKAESAKAIAPLPEKSWAGAWRGSYIAENKIILVEANLVLVDAVSSPMKWRVEFKLPKGVKQEWKMGEFTLHYFQTAHAHWMEIRNAKTDIVFLAKRKAN